MENNRKNAQYEDTAGEVISWIITFILLFTIWPVGVFMLVKKLRKYARTTGRKEAQSVSTAKPVVSGTPAAAASTIAAASAVAAASTVAAAPDVAVASAAPAVKKTSKKNAKNPLLKKSGKFVSVILLLISIVMFIIGANFFTGALRDIFGGWPIRWLDLGFGAFYLTGGLISFFSRNIPVNRFTKYKRYYAFVNERGVVSLTDISRGVGYPMKTVLKDLQSMINAGYFGPNAYIDNELDSLVLFAEAAAEARRNMRAEYGQPSSDETPEKPENQYMAIITELRDLNDTIADVSISEKIDRIEMLTAKIFRIVEDNPSKLPQIRRFMNYYLPTTLKLLHSYATLEKQDIKGENIDAAKVNIDRILETLTTGYAQQLDQLFQSDVIDIAADINVLENMMQQDGLTAEKPELRTMGGV